MRGAGPGLGTGVVVGVDGSRIALDARVLFGSTSRAVLRRSPVPVVVVSPDAVLREEAPTAVPIPSSTSSDSHDRSRLW